MSVSTTHYIFFGFKLKYSEIEAVQGDDDDFFYDLQESEKGLGFDLITDDMSGQYAYAGHIAVEADEISGFNHIDISNLSECNEIFPVHELGSFVKKIDNAKKMFNKTDDDVKLWIFSHVY